MRLACICPSVFDYPHMGTPSVVGIAEFLEHWFEALVSHQCKIVFSPAYINDLKSSWWPKVTSCTEIFRFHDCWGRILKASEDYSAIVPNSKQVKATCGCKFASSFWHQQLNDLKSMSPIVVTENCTTHPTGFQTISVESDLDNVNPNIWMKYFSEKEQTVLPLQGVMFYAPPDEWNRHGIIKKTIRCGTNYVKGYPDCKGRVWSYDKTEDHWDVYSQNNKWYDRVTPQGKQLERHLCQ